MGKSTDPLLEAIQDLVASNDSSDAAEAVNALHQRLKKIAKHPFEDSYRIIRGNDEVYQQKIGRLHGSTELIECAGFLPKGKRTWELVANAEAWPKMLKATAMLEKAVNQAKQANSLSETRSPPAASTTARSTGSRESSRTAVTRSTSSSSLRGEEPHADDIREKRPRKRKDNKLETAPSNKSGKSKKAAAESAVNKLKAAVLSSGRRQQHEEQEEADQDMQEDFSQEKKPKSKSAAASSAIQKLKNAAKKAKTEDESNSDKNKIQSSRSVVPEESGLSAEGDKKATKKNSKKANSAKAKEQEAVVGGALAKLKAAALSASQQQNQKQSQARQNPLKLAAQHAANGGKDTEDESERSLTLNDIYGSADNPPNTTSQKNPPSSALSKFKAAAQQVQQHQYQEQPRPGQNSFNNSQTGGPMANRFRQKGSAPVDPRSRFQNAAQAMMLQRNTQQNGPQDPRARFQNAAQAMMMQQRMQQPSASSGKPLSVAERWKMATNAAQAQAHRKSFSNSLSYPTSSDSNPALGYPSVTADASRPNGGRPFALRTDSGRSLMSSASNLSKANSMALVPAGPRQDMMRSASMRQGSVRGLMPQQSFRGPIMHQASMNGMSRPQLMKEQSMSMNHLKPGMMSSRHSSMGGSFRGEKWQDGKSSTTMMIEQPKEPEKKAVGMGTILSKCTTNAVSLVTFGELVMDLITNILSFMQMGSDFDCCGRTIDYGALTLAVTIPYFFIVVVEMVMLFYSVFCRKKKEVEETPHKIKTFDDFDDDSVETTKWECSITEALSWVICLNPFLGCLITWVLMYEVGSKNEALLILGVEGAAIFFMFITLYLERNELSTCTMMIHLIPLVPFAATCFVVWYYLEQGGICFIVKENTFWFTGCEVCSDGFPADGDLCPDGQEPEPVEDEFCGDAIEDQFCYYSY